MMLIRLQYSLYTPGKPISSSCKKTNAQTKSKAHARFDQILHHIEIKPTRIRQLKLGHERIQRQILIFFLSWKVSQSK